MSRFSGVWNRTMQIVQLQAFRDNYIWVLRKGKKAAVVDPGDAAPVMDYLRAEGLALSAILVTHHHNDHVGGIEALLREYPAEVFGLAGTSLPGLSHPLEDGEEFILPGLGIPLRMLAVPGHTLGHGAYYGSNSLFCGDTLFGCGCGRLFEGTPRQMHDSLTRLASLPGDTLVYCAHEYTEANIRFALTVEPGNGHLQARARETRSRRASGLATVPSRLEEELATNPFLRSTSPEVIAAASSHLGRPLSSPVDVFAAIRSWKDGFQG